MQWLYQTAYACEMGAWCCRVNATNRVHDDTSTEVVPRRLERDVESASVGRVLVFVNPNSGSGKGVKTFRHRVEPQLKKNHIDYELIITNGPNHAKTIVRSRDDLLKFNGVIILSGDGLVFEVINGLFERSDRTSIIPCLPIGIVPSGSGNGLLCSLLFSRGEPLKNPKFTERAIEISCSPSANAQAVNLIHVQTDKSNMAAFLSVGWGLMADIDIESERWRKSLGSNRFVLGGLIRALNLRTYRGRLAYKLCAGGKRGTSTNYDIYGKNIGERMLNSSRNSSEEEISLSHRPLDAIWRSLHSERVSDVEDEIPQNWTVIEDEFISVYAVTVSHISNDGPFAPKAYMDDDRIYLTYILQKDLPGRLSLIKYLTAIESQKHLDLPFVQAIEVSAFRLEPLDSGSYVVVDDLRTYRGRLAYKLCAGGKRGTSTNYDIYGKNIGERMLNSSRNSSEEEISLSHRPLDAIWRSLHSERVSDVEDEIPQNWTVIEDEFISVYAVTVSHISNDGPFAPKAYMDDDRIYLTYILQKDLPGRLSLIKYLTAIESQKHLDLPFVQAIEVSAFRLEPLDSGSYVVVDDLRTYRGRLAYKLCAGGKRGTSTNYDIYGKNIGERMLNSSRNSSEEEISLSHRPLDAIWRSLHSERVSDVEDEIPQNWTVIEDEFISVYAVTVSHISNDGPFAPKAYMDDDRIYLTYILQKDLPGRLSLIKYLTAIESQKHLDLPFVQAIEVSAFRLEPLDSGSYVVVDGEVVDAKRIQATTSMLKTAVFAP
ncbi:hypothetical protein RB195_016687 [Necator americanus]|uniref:DAGKc domain-containing protein n=2 Tax=Necator americanus TaxID=51031 RepID=A0ABR1C4X3_NECAM